METSLKYYLAATILQFVGIVKTGFVHTKTQLIHNVSVPRHKIEFLSRVTLPYHLLKSFLFSEFQLLLELHKAVE